MAEKEQNGGRASISGGTSPEEIGEFWDTHDFTEYEAGCPDVTEEFEIDIRSVRHLVALDAEVMREAIASARKQGISVQTLVNLAVREAVARRSTP